MKGLKYSALLAQDAALLEKQIAENGARLTALRFQKVIGQLENTAQFETIRRDIARMKTALAEQKNAAKK